MPDAFTTRVLNISTGSTERIFDLTGDCAAFLREVADGRDGLLNIFVPHATAGIAIIETGAGSDDDLLAALHTLLPADDRWQHRHGSPGHGRDHVLPAFVPPHATLPVVGGGLELGTWQSVCLVDTNISNANRHVKLSFLGMTKIVLGRPPKLLTLHAEQEMAMPTVTWDETEQPYDGCGKCLLGVRRLSRVKAATTSPERQLEDVLAAAKAVGGHIIGWADDWEVSGATDPMTRPRLGPWLRDERGPYDGLVAAAVDRLGRNVVDCLNTGYKMRDENKLLVTYGHDGPWNLDDPADENRFTIEAWGAQMELRAIQRRNRDATVKMRAAGRTKQKPSYGFQHVRTVMGGRVDRVEIHPHAAAVIRDVARRILADPENVTPSSEAARLNRMGELAPKDHLAVMYGRPSRGRPWYPTSLRNILLSEAALGYLMHDDKPVIDRRGEPARLCEGLWDRGTHEALKRALSCRQMTSRHSNRPYLLTGLALCGKCHNRLLNRPVSGRGSIP